MIFTLAGMALSLLFSLSLTLVANLLPQVKGEAPLEKVIDLGARMDSFVAPR